MITVKLFKRHTLQQHKHCKETIITILPSPHG